MRVRTIEPAPGHVSTQRRNGPPIGGTVGPAGGIRWLCPRPPGVSSDATRFVGIDPSTTRTGFAIVRAGNVLEAAGYVTSRARDGADRVLEMARTLPNCLAGIAPTAVAIEIPSGKVAGRHGGGGSGLSLYGFATGWLACVVHSFLATASASAPAVFLVDETGWTRGIKKALRQRTTAIEFPHYRAAIDDDGGADCADAIQLAQFAESRHRLHTMMTDHSTLSGLYRVFVGQTLPIAATASRD